MVQISNNIFCEEFLTKLNIETKILPNPYYDYPYLIIKNFLSSDICEEITKFTKGNKDKIDAKLQKKSSTFKQGKVDKQIRKAKIHKLNTFYENIYNHTFIEHQEDIERFFSLVLSSSTKIQTLEYTKGSFYKKHCDDSNVIVKDEEVLGFIPMSPEKKIATVLFTTSHSKEVSDNNFDGGELVFNYLYNQDGTKVQLKPQAGDMLVFLSNPYFTHEVLEVTNGYRLTLVQWHNAIMK